MGPRLEGTGELIWEKKELFLFTNQAPITPGNVCMQP